MLTISESDPYDYGSVAVGSTVLHTFTITNTGSGAATSISEIGLAAPFSFSGGVYPGTGGTCTAVLSGGGTNCDIVVEFSPTSVGLNTDSIEIAYNDGVSTQTTVRSIEGTGATPASLVISESDPYDYGSIATSNSADHTFTVTNVGGMIATSLAGSGLVAPYDFKGGSYPGSGGTCGAVLASGSNCTVVVDFSPVVTGLQSDTIDINFNDGVSAQVVSRDVAGTGI